jgi:hypothetical protein
MANWGRKSQYLLREIVKYKTYLEILSKALERREDLITKSTSIKTPVIKHAAPREPWFDLGASPNSVSTTHTKDAVSERGLPT